MIDDRITRYLHDQAGTIELRPASPAAVVHRARRRRQARRTVALTVAVTLLGASTGLVTQRDDGSAELAVEGTAVTPSALDWAVVEPTSGLSSVRSEATALLDDGSVYSLSTAPGAAGPAGGHSAPATLYRSVDGADWAPVELPPDLWASSLTGQGTQLYAVGTAPAGGGMSYQFARSDDGGLTWSTTDLPADLATLVARYPGEIIVEPPSIAVHDGTVVVSASARAALDVESRLPPGVATDDGGWGSSTAGWEMSDEGVVLHTGECERITAPTTDEDGNSVDDTTCLPGVAADVPIDSGGGRAYTWAELGVSDELLELVLDGRNDLFVSHDGGEFAPLDAGGSPPVSGRVVASDEGFTLFLTSYDGTEGTTEVRRSADGTTWVPSGELPGGVGSAGVVAGRPAVALTDDQGRTTIRLGQADGSWLSVDPGDAFGAVDAHAQLVAFGPLGWVATVWTVGEGEGTVHAVHSVDGTAMSLVPVDDVFDRPEGTHLDVSVTADAVQVRVQRTGSDAPGTPPRQWVVVGTPSG